jgi:hypothetical protein
MPSQADLYEYFANDCVLAAGRTDDPKSREMLLKLAREWTAALQALTKSKPPSTGVGG